MVTGEDVNGYGGGDVTVVVTINNGCDSHDIDDSM